MVCHIFSDMAKASDTDTAEETMESLDDPDRADENGAPEAKDQRPDKGKYFGRKRPPRGGGIK